MTESNTLPIDIEELLKQQREDLAARLSAPSGDYVKIGQDKTFSFPDGTTTAGPFEGIILDFQYHNVYYEGNYVRGKPNRALCYANNAAEDRMAPPDGVPDRQADSCVVCPNNQFGSGNGGGKACKNGILIALLPPDATTETPIHVLATPPTSMKHFQKYMRHMTLTAKRSPIEVVTRIGFNPETSYAQPLFDPASSVVAGKRTLVPNPILALCVARKEEARARLEAEKPDMSERPGGSKKK